VPPPTGHGPRGKPATRRTLLARRDALTERERADKSALICARAGALLIDRLPAPATVAIYAPKGTEVETRPLDEALRAGGYTVVYPRVIDEARVLAFHPVVVDALVPGRFGLREPPTDAPAVALDAISAFVVPGLAFDRGGGRVGWGRGYYDATLTLAAGALRIGLAFECQLTERVPRESHDALLHEIITEAATYTVA
jgi:5-formyltetrahydrofolate cyclo-ligase